MLSKHPSSAGEALHGGQCWGVCTPQPLPGILVGVRSQHLHSHQHGVVRAAIQALQGKVLPCELLHPLHFTEVNLGEQGAAITSAH